jgi:MHS family shikimate/dehydroshikimate transporter-like MFS transporter
MVDFIIYGTTSALVFNKLFFSLSSAALGTIAAFATHGVGFLARPLPSRDPRTFWRPRLSQDHAGDDHRYHESRHFLDRHPTYGQIGILARILLVLLRLLQDIGFGGEWGGAVLMVVGNAPARSRGLLGATVQIGFPIGNIARARVAPSSAPLSRPFGDTLKLR